jgi:hypothetical protein
MKKNNEKHQQGDSSHKIIMVLWIFLQQFPHDISKHIRSERTCMLYSEGLLSKTFLTAGSFPTKMRARSRYSVYVSSPFRVGGLLPIDERWGCIAIRGCTGMGSVLGMGPL